MQKGGYNILKPPFSPYLTSKKYKMCTLRGPKGDKFYSCKYKTIQDNTEIQVLHAKFINIPILQRTVDVCFNHPSTHYHHRFYLPDACYYCHTLHLFKWIKNLLMPTKKQCVQPRLYIHTIPIKSRFLSIF